MPAPKSKITSEVTARIQRIVTEVIASDFEPDITTRDAFAKSIGILPMIVSRWFSGDQNVTVEQLVNIANRYKINGDWLLTGKGDMYVKDRVSTNTRVETRLKDMEVKLDGLISTFRNQINRKQNPVKLTKNGQK
jgi:hypothetical protein